MALGTTLGTALGYTLGMTFALPFEKTFFTGCYHRIAKDGTLHQITVVGSLLLTVHLHQIQFLTRLLKTRRISFFRNVARSQEVEPLIKRNLRLAVEVVHLKDDVFGKELTHLICLELLLHER